jgi:hypothetical protein
MEEDTKRLCKNCKTEEVVDDGLCKDCGDKNKVFDKKTQISDSDRDYLEKNFY